MKRTCNRKRLVLRNIKSVKLKMEKEAATNEYESAGET